MREERVDSQISSSHNLRVRAIQSTQVDLEQDLGSRSKDTRERGNGDIRRYQTSRKIASSRLGSFTNCRESIKGQDTTQNRPSSCNFITNTEENCYGTTPERYQAEKITRAPKRPVASSSLKQLSDDINVNAADVPNVTSCNSVSSFLNQDNNAKRFCGSRTRQSRTNCKSKSKCRINKSKRVKAASGTRVINLPPNTVLKITSQSRLGLQKGQLTKSAVKPKTAGSSLSQQTKRRKSCSGNPKSLKNVISKHSGQLTSWGVKKSNSSRYRVTPCPAVTSFSRVSNQSSLRSTSQRTSSLTSAGAMKVNSRSGRPWGLNSGASSRYSGSKRGRRMRTSRRVASSSRRRHDRSWYGDFPEDLLFDHSRKSRKRTRSSSCRARRGMRVSSTLRRRSRASPLHRLSRHSVTASQKRRGRPRGSRKKSTSNLSVANLGSLAQAKSSGFLNRVSSLWSSCSFSRSPSTAKAPSSSRASSSSRAASWMSRILPMSQRKYQRRLKKYRGKASKYIKARKEEKAAAKRRAPSLSSVKNSKDEKPSRVAGICSIM